MNNIIPDGVWPTMITPFTENNDVDFKALKSMIDWYQEREVDGLFAVCQSSEMFELSLDERIKIAGFVKEETADKVSVIASGHISDTIDDQIGELEAMAATGIDALVLVSNRLAGKGDSEQLWKQHAIEIMNAIPDIPLGIYECPHPFKWEMSPELLNWCANTDRFYFLKDTSCDIEKIEEKLKAVKNSNLKIFNANSSTLLATLKSGVAGFSGVMGNFHPELYKWLIKNWEKEPEKAEELQDYLGFASLIENQVYPVNAKYFLHLHGIDIGLTTRTKNLADLTSSNKLEVEQFYRLSDRYSRKYTL